MSSTPGSSSHWAAHSDDDLHFHVPLRVRVCTWNLGGKPVSGEDDLAQLLLSDTSDHEDYADIYAIGTQELVELSMGNIFLATDYEEEKSQKQLEAKVVEELKKTNHAYVKIGSIGMVGLFLVVYVRKDLEGKVKEKFFDRVRTGMFHLAGNKGAVCCRFSLYNITYCFINVHLHHGQENQAARSQDIDDTLRHAFQGQGTHGTKSSPPKKPGQLPQQQPFERMVTPTPMADRHDLLVIFGDFNFRLNVEMSSAEPDAVAAMVAADPKEFFKFDQFRSGGMDILREFKEGQVHFNPTYKFKLGTKNYDLKRVPAWCDRILFKFNSDRLKMTVPMYDSLPALYHTSDHQPVVAILEVQIRDEREPHLSSSATLRGSWWEQGQSGGCLAGCIIGCASCLWAVASEVIKLLADGESKAPPSGGTSPDKRHRHPQRQRAPTEEGLTICSPSESPSVSPGSRPQPRKRIGTVGGALKATLKPIKKGLQAAIKFEGGSPDASSRRLETSRANSSLQGPPVKSLPPKIDDPHRPAGQGMGILGFGAKPVARNL